MNNASEQEPSFEASFQRLEQLLDKLNKGECTLEESLHYYEEAEKLLNNCNKRLNDAERRIEKLVKYRNDEVAFDEKGNPRTEPFSTP